MKRGSEGRTENTVTKTRVAGDVGKGLTLGCREKDELERGICKSSKRCVGLDMGGGKGSMTGPGKGPGAISRGGTIHGRKEPCKGTWGVQPAAR